MSEITTTNIAREALEHWYQNQHISLKQVSRDYCKKYGYNNPETLRKVMGRLRSRDEKKERHQALGEALLNVGVPIEDVQHYWYKGKHFSAFVKEDKESIDYELLS